MKNDEYFNYIDEYINGRNFDLKNNANYVYSNVDLCSNLTNKLISNYWLNKIFTKTEKQHHIDGIFYIHDLGHLSPYCIGWSFEQFLEKGFNCSTEHEYTNVPHTLSEVCEQLCEFFKCMHNEWAGAQSLNSFDTYLAPYVYNDNLSIEEIKEILKKFIIFLNTNILFVNFSLDFRIPDDLKYKVPYILQHSSDDTKKTITYGQLLPALKKIDEAFYSIMNEGNINGEPFVYPIINLNIDKNFDWDSQLNDLVFKNAIKYGNTYFQNFVGININKSKDDCKQIEDVRSMCCRMRFNIKDLIRQNNGLFGSNDNLGSIGVVTINLARIGYLFKTKKTVFKELKRILRMIDDIFLRKRKLLTYLLENNFFPYTKRFLNNFDNHFNTVGIVGMNEFLRNYSGDSLNITSYQGVQFALEILDFINKELYKLQCKSGVLYNFEATPAEMASYKLAIIDHNKYKDILQAGHFPNIYYTNSSQLPVDFTDDPFEMVDLQTKLQNMYSGGSILHFYISENNIEPNTIKSFIKNIIFKTEIPSFTISPVFSICKYHGYINGAKDKCPMCSTKLDNWSRVMGYYRPISRFNNGKIEEYNNRKYCKCLNNIHNN